MKYLLWAALLSIGLMEAKAQNRQNNPSPAKLSKMSASPLVTLQLDKVTFGEAILALAQKYHVSIIADTYVDDLPIAGVNISETPLEVALQKLAELFQREVEEVNGIKIFRHNLWYMRPKLEKQSMENYGYVWKSPGEIRILPTEKPLPVSKQVTSNTKTNLRSKKISLFASAVPMSRFLVFFRQQSGWPVSFERSINPERRISVYLEEAHPGQTLEALTYLLNARQSVAIGQNAAQQEMEVTLAQEANDTRNDRVKMSDALKLDLFGQLTPAQRAELERGQQVALPVDKLPDGLRKRVESYINVVMNEKRDLLPATDPARGLRIVLLPPPSLALGVDAFDHTGRLIGF